MSACFVWYQTIGQAIGPGEVSWRIAVECDLFTCYDFSVLDSDRRASAYCLPISAEQQMNPQQEM
jgi:hypothetical protein